MSIPAPPEAGSALPWRQALWTAAKAFALSRLLVFAAVLLPAMLSDDTTIVPGTERVLIDASRVSLHDRLMELSTRNDAGWYHSIVVHGYEVRPFDTERQANWAFFPLHPLLWRAAVAVFGDGPLAALLCAHVALFVALALLYLLVRDSGRDAASAERAVFALALFPVSYFLSFPWSESLFLALTIATVLAAHRLGWGKAALFGACASATRVTGVLLAVALLVDARRRGTLDRRALAALAIMPLGLVAFMVWLAHVSGNPFAFSGIQAAWGRDLALPVRAIGIVVLRPWEIAVDWNVRWLNLGALCLGLLAAWHFLRRREIHFAAFLGLGLAAPLLTDTLTSFARYAMGLFPVAIALADWTASPRRERVWFVLSVALLVLLSVAFGAGYSFAGT